MNDLVMTPQFVFYGILAALIFIGAIIYTLYRINTGVRRSFKKTHDDARIEKDIEAGDTLHAEGIYGGLHPEEPGLPLKQTQEKEAKEYSQKSARP